MTTQPFSQTGQIIELCCQYLSVRCIWIYVIIVSRTRFRVSLQSIAAWMRRNSLLETGAISDVYVTVNGWVFVYDLSSCGFESRCCHLPFRYCASLEQEVPWHSGNCKVWIHSETRKWHGINIQYIHCFAYFIWLSIKWLYLTKKVCFQATHLWYTTAKSYRYIFFLENSKICLSLSLIFHRRVR